VPALDEHQRAVGAGHAVALREGLVPRRRRVLPGEHGELLQVRGDQVGEAEHRAQGVLGLTLQQAAPGGRDHDGVQDHDRRPVGPEPPGDGLDDRHGPEHPDLDGVDLDVLGDRVQLCREELDRRDVDGAHAHGVLHDDGGDGAHPVAAHRGDRLEVRVLAGAARGVGAGDGQDAGHAGGHGATSPAGTAAKARR
jgi:hypothetical protein